MEQMIRGGVVVAADIGGLAEVVGDAGNEVHGGRFRISRVSPRASAG